MFRKSDVGGVGLNLTSDDAVRAATITILARAKALRQKAQIMAIIVQAMVVQPKARELILGLADDPTFGTVVVFGHGGTAVEIINDKALALPPLDLQLARDLIERTRVSRLLRAYRDVPAVKRGTRSRGVWSSWRSWRRIFRRYASWTSIRYWQIKPAYWQLMRASPSGTRRGSSQGPVLPTSRCGHIHRNGSDICKVKDGWRVFVRPIRPEDEPRIHELLRHVTSQDLRLRFFAPMKEFTHEFIARLTQLDYARAMAFVAFDEVTNELVGMVRLHSDSIYESGEYAILLRSDLKGRGLGWTLMQMIIEYAKSEGLKRISGEVLQENTAMLKMCRELGFAVKSDTAEPTLCNVTLELGRI